MTEQITDPSAHGKLLKARSRMVVEYPFFASLALRLKMTEDSSCETAWTDGKTFGYNPAYIHRLNPETLMGLCSHTVMHPACHHHVRRKNRDPETWNRACDLAINPILLEAGMELPPGFLHDPKLAGKSADAIYDHLTQCQGEDEEEGESDPNADDPSGENQPQEESSTASPEGGEGEEDEPSGEQNSDPGMAGEVRDSDAPEDSRTDGLDDTDWEEALSQALTNAREMGRLPRGVERWIKEMLYPKLPWQQLLSRFVHRAARSDYSWVRPNPRYLSQDLYLPSLANHELGELVVAVDTSGSIQPRELDQFAAEISAVLELVPARVHLLYCDRAVNKHQIFSPWDLPLTLEAVGGGGTDFRPAFQWLDQRGLTPDCMIYLTDLECRLYPAKAPGFPVVWVKTGTQGTQPPFGQIIAME